MKTVLIVAYECAPYNRLGSTIGAQRPFQFAKHFPKFGWKAVVLCSDWSKRYSLSPESSWKQLVTTAVREKLDSQRSNQSVIIPLPSLKFVDSFDRLWLESVDIANNGTFQSRPGIVVSLKRKIASFFKLFRGDHSQSWQPVAVTAANEVIKSTRVDFIIAEHGPDASIYVCRQLHHKHRIPWCVDFRDPVLRFYKGHSRLLMKFVYRHYLKTTAFLVNVHKHWVFLDKHDFRKPAFIVTNGFDSDEFTNSRSAASDASDPILKLFYGGNINFKYQDIAVLFDAIALLNRHGKRIQFTYIGNGHAAVARLAAVGGITDNVTTLGMMPRNEYLRMVASADILLILSFVDASDRFFKRGLYPGKVFEYFALRKPIICVPGDGGLLDELLSEVGVGKSFDSPDELATYLLEMLECKEKGAGLPYRPMDKIHFYSRESQVGEFVKHLDWYCQS